MLSCSSYKLDRAPDVRFFKNFLIYNNPLSSFSLFFLFSRCLPFFFVDVSLMARSYHNHIFLFRFKFAVYSEAPVPSHLLLYFFTFPSASFSIGSDNVSFPFMPFTFLPRYKKKAWLQNVFVKNISHITPLLQHTRCCRTTPNIAPNTLGKPKSNVNFLSRHPEVLETNSERVRTCLFYVNDFSQRPLKSRIRNEKKYVRMKYFSTCIHAFVSYLTCNLT